ncbi:hypothetical protein [Candidatus Tisiphia endosymbiont of Ptychoptera albimana]|uniref:hypothetical protein n=1 Tax=Candidatus Tisiphia endosymbiont of Ptychoptera albimana TaxID=3066260 RepID=UPI00312C7449
MAKTTRKSEKDLNTADDFYKLGEQEYKIRGEILTTGIGTKAEIEGYGVLAAGSFYQALTLGHQKAPFSLYACFGQGVGVKQDNDIAAMMFGVARNIKDPRCKGKTVTIPKSVESKVKELTKLVKESHSKIPAEGVNTDKVLEQMAIFQTITLLDGRSLQDCFTEKVTQDNSKEQELKSHILQLTKNLPKHNNTTIATKAHHSSKTNSGISRNGFGIS